MRLNPTRQKIFNNIMYLSRTFNKFIYEKNHEMTRNAGRVLIEECNFLLESIDYYKNENQKYSINEYCRIKDNDYEIAGFVRDKIDFVENTLRGLKNA